MTALLGVALSIASCGRVDIDRVPTSPTPQNDARVGPADALPRDAAFDGTTIDAALVQCPGDGLVGEWRADGTFASVDPCLPLQARERGTVAFGEGRIGQAWQFRSTWTGDPPDGDPNYLWLESSRPVRFDRITIDAWVRFSPFNAYGNSNRVIFATSWNMMGEPGIAWMYQHENREVFFLFTSGSGFNAGMDWGTCRLSRWEGVPVLDTWIRLTATYDGEMLRCYIDGAETDAAVLRQREAATEVVQPWIGRNFPGDVDALRIFDRALSADEIAQPWP